MNGVYTLKPEEINILDSVTEMVIDLRIEESVTKGKPDCAFCAERGHP